MSYEIGEQKGGGYSYHIEVNGLVMTGWRHSTRTQVEEYAKRSERMCVDRANGIGFAKVTSKGKNGTSHLRGKGRQ